MSASYVAPLVKAALDNSRTDSLAAPTPVRSHRARIRSFELDRVFPRAIARSWASRSLMRPTDFCTPKLLTDSSTCAPSFPGAAIARTGLTAPSVDALVPRLAPRAHSHRVAWVCRPRARRRETGHRGARGRSMQVRPGKIAFHDATLTSVTVDSIPCGVVLPRVRPSDPPLTSLSPPPCWLAFRNAVAIRCESAKAAKIGSAGAS